MTDIENEPPRGHIKMVYMGPVAPHWEMRSDFGDKDLIDGLRTSCLLYTSDAADE